MKQILSFILYLSLLSPLPAQIVQLQTQAAIDNFTGDYIGSQLIIGPDVCCSDITDLSALSTVWGIGQKLRIQNNPLLKSLHGLENMVYMPNYPLIEIINNDSLSNLIGLADSIGGFIGFNPGINFRIKDNEQLVNLQGIPDCSKADLTLENNPALRNVEGCEKMNQMLSVDVKDCANFQSFHGLENVDTITQSLSLEHCPRLKNMQGLNNCKLIKYLYWNRLDSLENTNGLGNLRYTREIVIDSCARFQAMTDLERLGKSASGDWIQNLEITNCPWFGDFSGLSDTACFVSTYLSHSDSIETVRHFQRLHANATGILNAYRLHDLSALPTGITWSARAPSCGANNCPNLEFIHDTIPGRIDTMSNLGFAGCSKLTDISGFHYVKGVTDQLELQDFLLGTLSGLENLEWSRWISIYNCNLDHLVFLSSLDSVVTFSISGNIQSLSGLENLRTVDYLRVGPNPVLDNLGPIDLHTIIEKSLVLSYLTNMDSVNGFNMPDLMGANVSDNVQIVIEGCTNLKAITGFNGITTMPNAIVPDAYDNVNIQGNNSLESISGFQQLVYLKKNLHISDNPTLSDIGGFCNLFQNGVIAGAKHIQDNAPGANSYNEALAKCISSGTETINYEPAVSVFPNPASVSFTVSQEDDAIPVSGKIRVINAMGSVVLETPLQAEQTSIFCNSLPAGVYWVEVYGAGKVGVPVKLVISRS